MIDRDPVRLSIGGSPEVQDLLRSAGGDLPSRAQLDLLAAKIAPAAVAAKTSIALWIVSSVAVVGVATGIWYAAIREPEPELAAPQAKLMSTVSDGVVVQPAWESPPPPEPVAQPVAQPEPEKPPAKPTPVVKRKPIVVDTPPPQPPKPREIDLLDPAHAALRANDPARALALATEHAGIYPRGALSEEREAIMIEALHRLGRAEARTRFDQFVERFPRSGYRTRLERLVR